MLVTWYLSMVHGEDPLEPVYFKDFWEIFGASSARCTVGTLPQINRFPSRGLFSPGTQVFSHYPSDYFPGGWNESIPLELLGFTDVRPRGPTDFGGAWGKVISRFYEPKTAILKEANHVLHGNNNFLWFFY